MKIIGHRGARGLAPENTIAGLQKGLEHHVDMLEFDLRITKDGLVILHHDPYLTDPNGQKHVIADYTYVELKEHKSDLATFEEVLNTIGHPVPLYVEVKPDEPTKPIIKIIRSYLANGWKSEYFMLASFSQKTLLELHEVFPEIDKVVLEKWSGVRATQRARQLSTRNLCMNQKWLWKPFIKPLAKRGWKLYAYTLNDPVKAKRWASYGLAGVVTDYPDRFEK
ncbi:MAG: glycerophosphodiester phosphodiesterase [Candidatus Saccharibacteria bacterium]|nr:glycerophosphodiester phosphodiesterase [Candidatus Saccharibacteria bacterium]